MFMKSSSHLPYILCSICNVNHNTGSKHVYTSCHQKKLQSVLIKSALKVKEAKKNLQVVEIHDEDWEKDSRCWCYFCEAEVHKHSINNTFMIKYLGILHHFAEPKHYEAAKNMLKKNRKSSENIEKYVIKKCDLISFLDKIPEAQSRYLKQMESLNQKHILHLKEVEMERRKLLEKADTEIQRDSERMKSEEKILPSVSSSKSNEDTSKPKKAQGMKCHEVKLPPWLQTDDNSDISNAKKTVIGPSLEDLEKHAAHQLKKKLPAKRIGANFNRNSSTSSKWLPSFGGVWNQGRRKQSELQYRRRKRRLNEEIV